MMRVCNPSTMSVLGLYNYDNTLFNSMAYPAVFTADDKTTFLNNLLMEVAELEVIYTNPSFMKFAIENWSKKELYTWERIYAASTAEYNPIENYNRMEESTDTTEGTRKHTGTDTTTNTGTDTTTNTGTDTTTNTGTDTTTNSGTDTVTNSGKDTTQASGTDTSSNTVTNSGSDATTHQTAAFNSTSLVDSGRDSTAYGHAQSTSASLTHGQKEELTHGHVEATQHGHVEALQHGHVEALQHGHVEALQHGHTMATQHGEQIAEDMEVTRESTIHGNIGVTTSQQMLEQELEVVPKLNVINYMIDSFKNRFCILVY